MKKNAILFFAIFVLYCNYALSNTYYVTNVNNSGANSLYAAIDSSNNHHGLDSIYFNMPGTGPFTIQLSSNLPIISDPVLIDGFSQVGSSVAHYLIQINCNPNMDYVFQIASSNITISGLLILNAIQGSAIEFVDTINSSTMKLWNENIQYNYFLNNGNGIFFHPFFSDTMSLSNIKIKNNYFETYSNAIVLTTIPFLKGSDIYIADNQFTNSLTGHAFVFDLYEFQLKNISLISNKISNNHSTISFYIWSNHSVANKIDSLIFYGNNISNNSSNAINITIGGYEHIKASNFIFSHDTLNYNVGGGIAIKQGGYSNDTIENFLMEFNEITHNNDDGINFKIGAYGNSFAYDCIIRNNNCTMNGENGISIESSGACGANMKLSNFTIQNNIATYNQYNGVYMEGDVGNSNSCSFNNNIISNNLISNNYQFGLYLGSYEGNIDGNIFTQNSIFDNDSLGIKIMSFSSITNSYINPFPLPVISSVSFSGSVSTIDGYLNGKPNRKYWVEYFTSTTADPSGFGEGKTYIGADTIITDTLGYGTFSFNVSADVTPLGVTATATDLIINNTSEFGNMNGLGVGLSEFLQNKKSIYIYPNPAYDNLTIETSKKAIIEILNLQGQIIKRINTTDNKTIIYVSDLARGMYFIKVTIEKEIITKKFIKE